MKKKKAPTIRKATAKLPKGCQKGAPPHVGLWLVDGRAWSWWDGKAFSYAPWSAGKHPQSEKSSSYAIGYIERDIDRKRPPSDWCYYWPTKARVARINPETGECTGTGPCPYEAAGMPWPFKGKA